VINKPASQRDSILLITSNMQETALWRANNKNASALATSDHEHQQLVSPAPIIEVLLEIIYSSAANQLSGVNLQGASLYLEGLAVLPESGSAQCECCYCIRQKVMCIRPRCHLMIRGLHAQVQQRVRLLSEQLQLPEHARYNGRRAAG
jgi:hypothetical protein